MSESAIEWSIDRLIVSILRVYKDIQFSLHNEYEISSPN